MHPWLRLYRCVLLHRPLHECKAATPPIQAPRSACALCTGCPARVMHTIIAAAANSVSLVLLTDLPTSPPSPKSCPLLTRAKAASAQMQQFPCHIGAVTHKHSCTSVSAAAAPHYTTPHAVAAHLSLRVVLPDAAVSYSCDVPDASLERAGKTGKFASPARHMSCDGDGYMRVPVYGHAATTCSAGHESACNACHRESSTSASSYEH
jgi:hypothetical protein